MRKVIYVVKSNLHYYPPCVSQIKMINDLGVELEVWYGSSELSAIENLEALGITCKKLEDKRSVFPGKLDVLNNWLSFRRSFVKLLKTTAREEALFWFGTAETAIPLRGALNPGTYIVTLLELLDSSTNKAKLRAISPVLKKAANVVCCNEARSHLTKFFSGLKSTPFYMPNKPYGFDSIHFSEPSCEATENALRMLKNEKYIIYQGIIQNVEMLLEVVKALKELEEPLKLVMMGLDIRNKNTTETLLEVYPNILFIPYIPAPKHLEITQGAYLGLVFYSDETLNKAFCAPNKIYEYSGFGIPILANDIPGLNDTVGAYGAGLCVDFKKGNIKLAIERLVEDYDDFSANALRFFSSTDNLTTVKNILESSGIEV